MVQTRLATATILQRKDLTRDLWLIWVQPHTPYTFKAGQYCTVGMEGVERAYSIVSAPHEPLLELFIELVPHGELTPRLYRAQPGAALSLRPKAKGLFTFEERYSNHLMVATVTGVAPYVSILRSYLHQGREGHRFHVLQGASYQDEFAYNQELARYAQEHDFITYVPTVSRPQEERNRGWCGEKQRVNLIVERYIEQFGLNPQETLVYACGHPGMIEDVKEQMRRRSFPFKEERFWKQ